MAASGSRPQHRNADKRDTQREKMEARETAILAAATEVFAEKGVDGARMAEIARLANVAEGTLYLYYRNKQDLLAGVVGQFWRNLTDGAIKAIEGIDTVEQQLAALARYHLQALLEQFEVVALTYRVRQRHGEPEFQLAQIRDYVRVLDRVIQRGIDRGELIPTLTLWQVRDAFYGTLEFSARTLNLRGEGFDETAIANLLMLLSCYRTDRSDHRSATANSEPKPLGAEPKKAKLQDGQNDILARLERIEAAIKRISA